MMCVRYVRFIKHDYHGKLYVIPVSYTLYVCALSYYMMLCMIY